MIRSVLGVLAGVIVGGLVVGVVQMVGMKVFPPPEGMEQAFETQDFKRMEELIASLPLGSFLFVLLSYAVGSLAGGMTAGLAAPARFHPWPALVVGTVLLLFGVMNVYVIPHPLWFVACMLFMFHPFAWLGSWLLKWAFVKNGPTAHN